MPHHGLDAVAQDVAAQELNVVIQEDPVPRFRPLQRPPQPFHVRVDRPIRADDRTHGGSPMRFRAAQQTGQIRGPMGEDTERDLVILHTSLSHSARTDPEKISPDVT